MPTTHDARPTAPPFRLLTFNPAPPTAVLSPQVQTTIRDIAKLAEIDPESFEMIARIAHQLARTGTDAFDKSDRAERDRRLARVAKWLSYNPVTVAGLVRGIDAIAADEQEGGR